MDEPRLAMRTATGMSGRKRIEGQSLRTVGGDVKGGTAANASHAHDDNLEPPQGDRSHRADGAQHSATRMVRSKPRRHFVRGRAYGLPGVPFIGPTAPSLFFRMSFGSAEGAGVSGRTEHPAHKANTTRISSDDRRVSRK